MRKRPKKPKVNNYLYRVDKPTYSLRNRNSRLTKEEEENLPFFKRTLNKIASVLKLHKIPEFITSLFAKKNADTDALPRSEKTRSEEAGFSRWTLPTAIATCVFLLSSTLLLTAGILTPEPVNITINDTGRLLNASTTCATVGEFLETNNIVLGVHDVVEVPLDEPIKDDMMVVIRRAMPVSVYNQGQVVSVDMIAGTVGEAIEMSGTPVADKDEVYPSPDTYVSANMEISVIKVTTETIVEEEPIYYKEVTETDDDLAKGETLIMQYGEDGLQENTILITYKNGVEFSRELIEENIIKEPVSEITKVGTYVAPEREEEDEEDSGGSSSGGVDSTPGGDGVDWGGVPTLTEVPTTAQIHGAESLYDHESAPPPDPSIIAETVIIDEITAYTATGNQTATGTWPRIGTIAADPNRFPYETKVYVPGYGYGRIEDTGSMRHRDETLWDLYMPTKDECLDWGRKREVKCYILG